MTPQPVLFAEPCVICGSETGPTKRELVEWREPVRSDAGRPGDGSWAPSDRAGFPR